MPIKRGNTDREFASYIDKKVKEIETQAIKVLCKIGKEAHRLAVEHGSYHDNTGNLRSSIGWGVVINGKLQKQGGFKVIRNGSKGTQLGKQRLRELASEENKGITLIIVAGEDYSIYVEAMGYDVLTFSELQCKTLAEQLINNLLK